MLIYSAVDRSNEHCIVLLNLPMYISLIGLCVMWKNVSSKKLRILMCTVLNLVVGSWQQSYVK
jgi:hypothetical protein